MDYRAAATRQLKESSPAGSVKGSNSTATAAKLTNAPAAPAASDSSKMRANAPRTNASPGSSSSNAGSVPVSFAAVASAGKKAATGNGTGVGTRQNGERASPTPLTSTGSSNGNTSTTPATASASAAALTSLINVPVRVTLINDNIIEGVVFTYDVYSGVLALASTLSTELEVSQSYAASGKKRRLQVSLVTAANIKDIVVVTDSRATVELPEVSDVSVKDIEERKQAALRAARERAMRIGVGVSDEAQAIFEALSKTLPCRWVGNKIMVLDEVTIEAPYGVDNCKVSTNATYSLNRVKKVLQGEKSRLAQAGNGSS